MILKGRDNLHAEITGEVLSLVKSLQVPAPEPIVTTVLSRSLAPTIGNATCIFVSDLDTACPGVLVICLEHFAGPAQLALQKNGKIHCFHLDNRHRTEQGQEFGLKSTPAPSVYIYLQSQSQ